MPTLRQLSRAFPDLVTVIGVHAPKFPAERNPACVESVIDRCGIDHPVVHDADLTLWGDFGISTWPTLVFIGPDGCILGHLQGEPCPKRLVTGIGEMVRQWRRRLKPPAPLPTTDAARSSECTGRFRFPAKIKRLSGGAGPPLWGIVDSGHHQVVVCDDTGAEVRRFGRGVPGFIDLAGEECAFNNPQGLVGDVRTIYVADTGNHAIRRIDLVTGKVCTLAGTGARGTVLRAGASGRDVELASVWDLVIAGERLVFANAGTHQLGQLDLGTGAISVLAGSGDEDLADGEPADARLAQPTGLAVDDAGETVYFVDSETSSVRRLGRATAGRVETLVGAGLFEFGHRNGDFAQARLQHCRGLAWWQGRLVVADSYNGALRLLDLQTRQVSDLPGDAGCDAGSEGSSEELTFFEPSGVAAAGANRLLVADTNHHRLVEVVVGAPSQARVWAA